MRKIKGADGEKPNPHLKIFNFNETRVGRVKQFLTRFVQVGALSFALRFQRLIREGIKTVPYQEACIPTEEVPGSLCNCVGSNIAKSRTPQEKINLNLNLHLQFCILNFAFI